MREFLHRSFLCKLGSDVRVAKLRLLTAAYT